MFPVIPDQHGMKEKNVHGRKETIIKPCIEENNHVELSLSGCRKGEISLLPRHKYISSPPKPHSGIWTNTRPTLMHSSRPSRGALPHSQEPPPPHARPSSTKPDATLAC